MKEVKSFKAGDCVTLNSGGPKMTVKGVGKYGYEDGVLCEWFDGTKVKEHLFKPEQLQESIESSPVK